MRKRPVRRLAAGIAVVLMPLVIAPQALAHDTVIGGVPADGEQVTEFPDEVSLEFSGYVQGDFNTFAITDAETEEVLFSGQPEVNDRWVTLEVPEDVDPGPGEYRIGFQITSSDGHATRGMTTFTVTGDGTETPAATAASKSAEATENAEATDAAENAEDSGISPWVWVVGGIVVLALAIGGIMAAGRGRK